jgi:hypothetical protein
MLACLLRDSELARERLAQLRTHVVQLFDERLRLCEDLVARFAFDATDRSLQSVFETRDALFELRVSLAHLLAHSANRGAQLACVMAETARDRLQLLTNVRFEHVGAVSHVMLRVGVSVRDQMIQPCKSAFELGENVSQQNLANSIESFSISSGSLVSRATPSDANGLARNFWVVLWFRHDQRTKQPTSRRAFVP